MTDSAKIHRYNFEPIPKRFMVWDKKEGKFLDNPSEALAITPLGALVSRAGMIVCQSTNLFDKDDEEIFEGGIIDYNGDGAMLGIVVNVDGQWQLKDKNDNLMFLKGAPHQKLVGHILSNPKLLEER